jgi:diacylglycerol O-acyltransferase / wax synthase
VGEHQADRAMSASDSILWKMERDPVLRSTVTAVSLLDRSPDWERLRAVMAEATCRVPWLRQVVVAPFGLDSPRWTTDESFDLDYHLRRMRPPDSGSFDDVLRIAELAAMTPFDWTRPPWEFTLVEGVGTGAALIQKFHHAAIDGIGAMRLAIELSDRDPVAPATVGGGGPPEGTETGGLLTTFRTVRRLGRLPLEAVALVTRAARSPAASLRTTVDAVTWGARLLAPVGAPLSPIMRGRSSRLRFAAFDLGLSELRASARRTEGTLNDVFVAGVASGLRRYHEASGHPVDQLRMTLPISVRRPDDPAAGNRFVPVRFTLPLLSDARQLVTTVSRTVREWRDGPALAMTDAMASALNALPPPLVARVFGSLLRNVDFVATNIPGPTVPVVLAGAEIVGLYAFAPPSGAAVNVSLVTNAGRCCIGVNMDASAVGDPDLLVTSLQEGLSDVLELGTCADLDRPAPAEGSAR